MIGVASSMKFLDSMQKNHPQIHTFAEDFLNFPLGVIIQQMTVIGINLNYVIK